MRVRWAFVAGLLAGAAGCNRSGPTPPVAVPVVNPPAAAPAAEAPETEIERALNDRLGRGVTADRNANVLIRQAIGPAQAVGPDPDPKPMPAGFYARLGIAAPPERARYFLNFDILFLGRAGRDDPPARAARRPWAPADEPDVAAWLAENEKPLATLVEASRRPDYFNPLLAPRTPQGPGPLLGVNLAGVQALRGPARALAARALLRVHGGAADAAWQDLLACHRLGRLLSRSATLTEGLVGLAVEQTANQATAAYLAHAKLDANQVRARWKELDDLPETRPQADKLDLGERAFYRDALDRLRRGEGLPGAAGGAAGPDALRALGAIDWAPAEADGDAWYDRLIAAVRRPDRPARTKAIEQVNEDFRAAKQGLGPEDVARLLASGQPADQAMGRAIGRVLSGVLFPAVGKVQDAYDRLEQARRNLRIAFLLAAYRAEHGRYPAALTDLGAVPDDLFADKSLNYKSAGDGYVLYSVGVNGKDEGGRGTEDDPRGDDLTVRMPPPAPKRGE